MFDFVPRGLQIYMVVYLLLTAACVVIVLCKRRSYGFLTRDYFRILLIKERIAIYIIGTLLLLAPLPFYEMHSWDVPIAIVQPMLACLFAPWAVLAFYKCILGQGSVGQAFVAFCLMMFAGCWAVELYLLARDGFYMPDWLVNIPIGICCFLGVGMLMNIPLGVEVKEKGS